MHYMINIVFQELSELANGKEIFELCITYINFYYRYESPLNPRIEYVPFNKIITYQNTTDQ